ncbi:MAG: endolytic transglycosylase MltG [Patescibacteria group bacterium]
MFFVRRRRGLIKWLFLGLAIILMLVGYVVWQFFIPAGQTDQLVPVSISPGQGVKQIGYNLQQKNLIRSRWWFESWVWLKRSEKAFLAGDYLLPSNASVVNLTSLLTGGVRPTSELSLTFIEGWTVDQIGDYLADNNIGSIKEFKRLNNNPEIILANNSFLNQELFSTAIKVGSLEGYLFPDTYRVYRSAGEEDILVKMMFNFQKQIKDNWFKELDNRKITVHDLVTLASIVEKEVRSDKDRAMVADIFWRRLKIGQGLQADSTVNYATGKSLPSVSLDDLKIDSPYNTYKYRGLPPGPISNPGLSALQATLWPQANDYWYFLTTPQGQVIYSKTFEEHKIAKQKYLR